VPGLSCVSCVVQVDAVPRLGWGMVARVVARAVGCMIAIVCRCQIVKRIECAMCGAISHGGASRGHTTVSTGCVSSVCVCVSPTFSRL
jgi:hypothetical protein